MTSYEVRKRVRGFSIKCKKRDGRLEDCREGDREESRLVTWRMKGNFKLHDLLLTMCNSRGVDRRWIQSLGYKTKLGKVSK